MFSGLIEELGRVDEFSGKPDGGARLAVRAPELVAQCSVGDSMSVNGVCLTVVAKNSERATFDLSAETLRVTNLGRLAVSDRVNLELSLKVGDRLGGHFVTGHIDEVGEILSREPEGDCLLYRISASDRFLSLLVDRGSVAVDGISLTVTEVLESALEVVIIPHTAEVTTLGFKRAGDSVNLEADMIGKYVAKLVGR